MGIDIVSLLEKVASEGASDLFVSFDATPMIKREGKMISIGDQVLDAETNHQLIYSILNERDIQAFEGTHELNKSLYVKDVGRFRVNVFRQRGEPALVARYIKGSVPSMEQLNLPETLKELIMEERGLILVVGGTGTGKSTTLASMIDYRNSRRTGHILTVEDPIEFMHPNKKSLVNQREVGLDTLNYGEALKNALREAPDVILIGEIRDQQTMKHAIAYAETGHLCLATLHANNANQAVDRIINFFPEEAHRQLLQDLSLNLRAVIAQRLCVGIHATRVPAVELMIKTPYIAELIEKGKVDEIKDAMEKSGGRTSKTFDQALFELVEQDHITEKEALRHADSVNNLSLRFRMEKPGSSGGYPIKSEFNISRKAPFDHYTTFRVKALEIKNDSDRDIEGDLTYAINFALRSKGLREESRSPDIEVQYVYGIKTTKGLGLEPIDDEQAIFETYEPESESHHMVVINVLDTRTQKPVYRLTASRRVSDHQSSKERLGHTFVDLLSSLPVGAEY
jgi:twitching motility protein PilU